MTEVLDDAPPVQTDLTATEPFIAIPPGSVDPRNGAPLTPTGPDGDGTVGQASPDSSPPTVPFPAVTGTGEGRAPGTQPTAEEAHEAAVVHTDIELLHKSRSLKQKIENTGIKTVMKWQRFKARVGNALEPGEKGLKRRRDRAEKALAAREAYQNEAESGIVRDIRQSSVDIAKANLADRQKSLTNRNYRIEQRAAYVNTKVLIRERRRDEAFQHVREKVEVARGRKALRQRLLTYPNSKRERLYDRKYNPKLCIESVTLCSQKKRANELEHKLSMMSRRRREGCKRRVTVLRRQSEVSHCLRGNMLRLLRELEILNEH